MSLQPCFVFDLRLLASVKTFLPHTYPTKQACTWLFFPYLESKGYHGNFVQSSVFLLFFQVISDDYTGIPRCAFLIKSKKLMSA